jgi:dihydrofolate synthase/folylpolyglutamate synthase
MLALLPKDARYYFCKANIPRGLKAGMLKKKAKQYGLHGSCYPSVKEAYKQAKSNADSKDVVFVGGSAFTVAEVI